MNRLNFLTDHLPTRFFQLAIIVMLCVASFCPSASAAGLYVTLDGTGGGAITSDPAGINCPAASCSADFTDGSIVTLIPTANSTALFSGWSDACTNTSGNCSVTMNSTRTASAHFTAAAKARIVSTGTGYPTLTAAYTAANSGDTIMALDALMPDAGMTMAQGKNITIKGGYTAVYSNKSLLPTYVQAPLNISSGSLRVDGVTVLPAGNAGTIATTATAGAHGAITPSGITTLMRGTSQAYTITPTTGYSIATMTVDGVSIPPSSSYTFSNVQADHSISATFRIILTGDSTTITSVSEACTTEPMRGTVYYYCDCGTGAVSGCVAGNDANAGTDPAAPRRTIANAITRFNSLTGTNTIAFCNGGAFNAVGRLPMNNSSCAAGTTCNDLREYSSPTFPSSAKPVINNAAGTVDLFSFMGNRGGVRILNLKLIGDSGVIANRNDAFFIYAGAHDITMCNLEMDAFDIAVNHNSGNTTTAPTTPNIKLTGSKITNSRTMGYLGAGNNAEISYNYWDGNGGSNTRDHTIYLGSGELTTTNMKVIGNYIHGQYGPTCNGVVIVGHGMFDYLTVSHNVIEIDSAAGSGSCYGIGFGSGGYTTPAFFRHATFFGNTLKNTGNAALVIASCPECVIENNLIIQDWDYTYPTTGIVAPSETARVSPADDVSNGNIIRNNTIWFGPKHAHGALGINVRNEGTGHIVANNSVYYSSPSTVNTWGGVNCYSYPLPLASYAFIDNNHCDSNAAYSWVTGRGNLAAWQSYSAASGFDTTSIAGVNPLFTAPGADFTPAAGSPLLGAGSAAHGSLLDMNGRTRTNPPAIGALEGDAIPLSLVPAERGTSEGSGNRRLVNDIHVNQGEL